MVKNSSMSCGWIETNIKKNSIINKNYYVDLGTAKFYLVHSAINLLKAIVHNF
jgi:hypothetical protein